MKLIIFACFLLICVFNSVALSQIKKNVVVKILANDKLDREEFTTNGNRILTNEVNELVKTNYNGKLEKPTIQVDILNDYHEVGAYQLIFTFTVKTPKQYNDTTLCNSICGILRKEFLKLNVETGDCKCSFITK